MEEIDQYLLGPDIDAVVDDLLLRFPTALIDPLPKGTPMPEGRAEKRIYVFYDVDSRKVVSIREG